MTKRNRKAIRTKLRIAFLFRLCYYHNKQRILDSKYLYIKGFKPIRSFESLLIIPYEQQGEKASS